MAAEELDGLEVVEEGEDGGGEGRRRSRWVPLLVLLLILLVIWCLLWRFLDLRRAPDQDDRASVVSSEMVRVPDITGMTEEQAVALLEGAGFVVEREVSFDDLADPGTVASQDPAGGDRVAAGSTVFIGVVTRVGIDSLFADDDDDDRIDVPRVIRLTQEQAIARLEREGFNVRVVRQSSGSVPAGLVASQSPEGGARASEGSMVTIVVSTGRASQALITVPNVRGLTRTQAEARIRAAGLDPRPMWQPRADSVGRVYQQNPASGESLPEDELVFILIGVRP